MNSVRRSVEHAIRVKALQQWVREAGIAEVVSIITAMDDRLPRERAKARRAEILAEYNRLIQLGHGRHNAPIKAARKFADNPAEQENIARNIRRWREPERISDSVRSLRSKKSMK